MTAAGADAAPGWIDAVGLGPGVKAGMSTRRGGVSRPPFDSLNLRPGGLPGGPVDEPSALAENHRRLAGVIGAWPVWLEQVHGADVVRLTDPGTVDTSIRPPPWRADASVTTRPGVACTVLVADCLPVLFCAGRVRTVAVGAAHAGWRGLAAGVLERTVEALCSAVQCAPGDVRAWLGACIGPDAFEVGAEVLAAFDVDVGASGPARPGGPHAADAPVAHRCGDAEPSAVARRAACFRPAPRPDGSARWRADLAGLARLRLIAAGLRPDRLSGLAACTVGDASRFFSYRRDGLTGRMAASIRLLDPDGA